MATHDSWLELIDRVLRPARPEVGRCLAQADLHRAALKVRGEERARATARCKARIEAARSVVLSTDDGVVPRLMTELEREWRVCSRGDADGDLMNAWAALAPRSWHDRKRWRESDGDAQLDAAIALASDVDGVEAAESAVASFRTALAHWGVSIGPRVRWRLAAVDTDCTSELLSPALSTAAAQLARDAAPVVSARRSALAATVLDAAMARLRGRPTLAHALAHAASVDYVASAARLEANPVTPLRQLWMTGYALSEVDVAGVTLELPPL